MLKLYCYLTCYLLYYLVVANLAFATVEVTKCQSSELIESDLALFVQDFGPDGVHGTINVTMANTLLPGAVISVVTKSNIRGSVNIIADDIYLIHVDARIQKNELIINTSKRLNLEWHENGMQLINPVLKGAKTTTTLIYEAEGYRVFINGREVAFYEHRNSKPPRVIALYHDYIYKVIYMTSRETKKVIQVAPQ